jgi:hypothetical protein
MNLSAEACPDEDNGGLTASGIGKGRNAFFRHNFGSFLSAGFYQMLGLLM